MKTLYLLFLVFLFVFSVFGQSVSSQTNPHNVSILQTKWRYEIYNPALEESPFVLSEREIAEIDRRTSTIINENRSQRRLPPVKQPIRIRDTKTKIGENSVIYTYELKLRNDGDKTIQTLVWDFIFFDSQTKLEAGRQRFVTKEKIRPGKTKSLIVQSSSPPTGNIDAKNAGKKMREQYTEQVVIQGIEFAEGSIWQAP
jgi:hypothetical protein